MYNFKRLIKKYSKFPLTIKRYSEGYYDYKKGGKWVEGEEEIIDLEGAVLPLSNADLNYDEGGTYSKEDRKLYTYIEVKIGEKVTHKEKEYTVQESRDYADFDIGLNIYFMKRVMS